MKSDKIAIAALVITVLTSIGGWVVQWKIAKLKERPIQTMPTSAQATVLRLIYSVISVAVVLTVVVSLGALGIAGFSLVRGSNLLWYVLLPLGVAGVAITELFLVLSIRNKLKQMFGEYIED